MVRKKTFQALSIFLFFFIVVLSASVSAVTFERVLSTGSDFNDTFIDSGNPDDDNSGSSVIQTGKNPVGTDWRGFLKFNEDISDIKDDIINASLTLYVSNGADEDFASAKIYNVTSDWTDSGATWNNPPSIGSEFDSVPVSIFFSGNITFELTAEEIISQIENGRGFGLDTTDSEGHDVEYHSSEGANKPYLVIRYSDNASPDINLTYPLNTSYDQTITELNYTVSDTNLDTCWYTLNGGDSNTTITCGNNVTGLDSGEGSHTWTVYANDTSGNVNSSSVAFSVALNPPTITQDSPSNGTFFDSGQNINLSFTVTDPNGIGSVEIWHDFNGTFLLNTTRTDVTSGNQANNLFNISSDGLYTWGLCANDTTGASNCTTQNNTLIVDTTFPVFNNVQITTTQGSQNVEFNVTNYTETYCDSTFYSVLKNGSIDNGIENVSTTCNDFSDSFTVSAFDTFTLRVYMNDSAGNLNSTDINFTTEQLTQSPSGGGGSPSGTTTIKRIPATNFSIETIGGGDKLDVVLAKDSVRPRSRPFIIVNNDIEPVEVELRCDTTLLEENQTTTEEKFINICDYVEFEPRSLTLSPNEQVNTEGLIKIKTPNNATFGDEYNFNILVIEKIDESQTGEVIQRFSKLSVSTRVPIWALALKWSHVPFQDDSLSDDEKIAYPVFWISAMLAFIVFMITFFLLRIRFPAFSFLLSTFFFLLLLFSLLFML